MKANYQDRQECMKYAIQTFTPRKLLENICQQNLKIKTKRKMWLKK